MALIGDRAGRNRGNYVARHWRGSLPLPVAFWIDGVVATVAIVLGLPMLGQFIESHARSMQLAAILWFVLIAIFLAAWIWIPVGVWRSAGRYTLRNRHSLWGTFARMAVVAGSLAMVYQMRTLPTVAREFGRLAVGIDPLGNPARLELTRDGRTLHLSGNITMGTSRRFAEAIAAAPGLTRIALESDGGRPFEAERIAKLIRERRLDTHVERTCGSACATVLIAGRRRVVTPQARIGFHQPGFPGMTEVDRANLIESTRRLYQEAGIGPAFIDEVLRVPWDSMWHPSHERLLEAGVITGQTETLDSYRRTLLATGFWPDFARRYPAETEQAVRAAWDVRVGGGSAVESASAARDALARAYPRILAGAPDVLIDEYGRITEAKLRAAQAIGDRACVMQANNRLESPHRLPAALVARETDFLGRAARAPAGPQVTIPDEAVRSGLGMVLVTLPPEQLRVMLGSREGVPHSVQCGALVAVFTGVNRLDPEPRRIALRYLLAKM